jgi:hypothetical protein
MNAADMDTEHHDSREMVEVLEAMASFIVRCI